MDLYYDSPSVNNSQDLRSPLLKERDLAKTSTLQHLLRYFSPSERLLLYFLTLLFGLSSFAILAELNAAVSTTMPSRGGTLIEGQVGPARFINPILTMSGPDQDLTTLVYSGLMRALPDGSIVPDLSTSYEISEDGTTYTFTLSPDATFHDGAKVTAADILFTIQSAQNPDIKSPHRADWEGVSVSSPDEKTVIFKLPRAYAPFIYNTTLGILPKHLWQSTTVEEFPFNPLNTHPVGSGPYRIINVSEDSTGAATKYDLEAVDHFALGGPYLKRITFIFYPNEAAMVEAFNARKIDAVAGISPSNVASLMREDTTTLTVPLPRVFGIFFNQNRATVLADSSVRTALDRAINKDSLVQEVLYGYGVPLDGPIPPGVTLNSISTSTETGTSEEEDFAKSARSILTRGGWKFTAASSTDESGTGGAWIKNKQTLSFTLATADAPELIATANEVANYWRAVGVKVDVQVFPIAELNTNIIRPRNYDAILFGEVVGREGDFFAFWHSSQRNDPGLNLAMYANSKVDSLLATARATTDIDQRRSLFQQFDTLVRDDSAAVFLYAPEFIYVVPSAIQGVELGALTTPGERFLNVFEWYTDTERVWDIFATK